MLTLQLRFLINKLTLSSPLSARRRVPLTRVHRTSTVTHSLVHRAPGRWFRRQALKLPVDDYPGVLLQAMGW